MNTEDLKMNNRLIEEVLLRKTIELDASCCLMHPYYAARVSKRELLNRFPKESHIHYSFFSLKFSVFIHNSPYCRRALALHEKPVSGTVFRHRVTQPLFCS